MSTKIYNGYFVKIKNLKELNGFIEDVRSKIRKISEKEFYKAVAKQAAELIDDASLNKLKSTFTIEEVKVGKTFVPISLAHDIVRRAHIQIERTMERNPPFDFRFEVSFAPTQGGYLARVFTENDAYLKVWDKIPNISEFGYWNNSDDYPKGVTSRSQWKKRENRWKKAIPSGMAGLHGFSIDCVNNMFPAPYSNPELFLKNVFRHLPSREKRIERHTKDLTMNKIIKTLSSAKNEKIDEYNMIHYGFEALDYLKTESGKQLWDQERQSIEMTLPIISLETLKTQITLNE